MDRQFNKQIGAIIKDKRIDKRLTQIQVAKILGIPTSTYACYESGLRGMSIDTYFKICYELDMDPNIAETLI